MLPTLETTEVGRKKGKKKVVDKRPESLDNGNFPGKSKLLQFAAKEKPASRLHLTYESCVFRLSFRADCIDRTTFISDTQSRLFHSKSAGAQLERREKSIKMC